MATSPSPWTATKRFQSKQQIATTGKSVIRDANKMYVGEVLDADGPLAAAAPELYAIIKRLAGIQGPLSVSVGVLWLEDGSSIDLLPLLAKAEGL